MEESKSKEREHTTEIKQTIERADFQNEYETKKKLGRETADV